MRPMVRLPMSTDAESRSRAALLARACFVFNGFILANIALGALVRAHGAGLACPDWPLCFGDVVPRFDFKVAWEVSHRYVGWAFGAVTLALGFGVLRDAALRRAAGAIWGFCIALLALQGLLGALTVWQLLASWSVTSHLLVGNAWNASVLWLGLALRGFASGAPRPSIPRAAQLSVALAAAFLLFQVALGGLVSSRYAGLACSKWPGCYDDEWFPVWGMGSLVGLHVHHRANAYLLAAFIVWMAVATHRLPALAGRAKVALALVLVQMGVGIANVLLELRVEITALHTALAGALVLTLTSCAHAAFAKELR
jgi:cytochrome c oxidase assembly protein subunit 15